MKLLNGTVDDISGVTDRRRETCHHKDTAMIESLERRQLLAGVVALTVDHTSTYEGNGGTTEYDAVFPVTLSQPAFEAVAVAWRTEQGTAVDGVDYTGGSGILRFPPGTTSGTISVPILGNTFQQPDRSFYVRLSGVVGAQLGRTWASARIIDDDPPQVSVQVITSKANEAKGVAGVFRFTRTGPTDAALRVFYGVGGTATSVIDYAKLDASILIQPGKASVDVTIKPVADHVKEKTETVDLWLKRRPEYQRDKKFSGTVKIIDGDGTAPTASLLADPLTTSGGQFYQFAVRFTDDLKMDFNSVLSGSVQVTGPNNYSPIAELVTKSFVRQGTTVKAIFQVEAPVGEAWSATANGTYTVKVLANQVRDAAGNAMAATTVGTFTVAIAG